MVPRAMSLYGFRYAPTRRMISPVERGLAVKVGSDGLAMDEWCAIYQEE